MIPPQLRLRQRNALPISSNFFRQHFTKVTAVDGKNYSPGMSAAVDVTIFDGMLPVVKERVMERDAEGNVTRYEEAEYLPSDFNTLL